MSRAPVNYTEIVQCTDCRVSGYWNKAFKRVEEARGGDKDYSWLCETCAVLRTLAGEHAIHWMPGSGAYCPACTGQYVWGKRGRPVKYRRNK